MTEKVSQSKTFTISGEEIKKRNEWQEKIKGLYGEYGEYTYSFTPTGIGDVIKVKSHLTGLELDITDIDNW